jgi:hypothetical protein
MAPRITLETERSGRVGLRSGESGALLATMGATDFQRNISAYSLRTMPTISASCGRRVRTSGSTQAGIRVRAVGQSRQELAIQPGRAA